MTPHQVEDLARNNFNTINNMKAQKQTLSLGTGNAAHEFDLYESGRIIGGISTSPWFNATRSNNTGGQDRAATELLWLSLWQGKEKRVHVLTDREMSVRLFKRFSGACFPHQIEIQHFDITTKTFNIIGTL